MAKLKFKKNRGFSLLEVLIAITLITVGLVACLSLISASLKSYKNSSQSVIDANKVQECLELARNDRDRDPGTFFAGASNKEVVCTENNLTIKMHLYDWQ